MKAQLLTLAIAVVFLFVQSQALQPSCAPSSIGTSAYLQCARMECSLGNRCECGCGSWCGYDGPAFTNDTTPRCLPAQATPDVPTPFVPVGNPCAVDECPYRSLSVVSCPTPTGYGYTYSHSGASCDRDPQSGACYWSLPECDPLPPPAGVVCDACNPAAIPAPPAGSSSSCAGTWAALDRKPGYHCETDGAGNCSWVWRDCGGQLSCPKGMFQTGCGGQDLCSLANVAGGGGYIPASCGNIAPWNNSVTCVGIQCGGCNIQLQYNGQDICPETYRASCATSSDASQPGINCVNGYTCNTDNYPYCIWSQTCDTLTCPSNSTCAMQYNTQYAEYHPVCIFNPVVPISWYTCDKVTCNDGYTCQNVAGGNPPFKCVVASTGACANSDCGQAPACLTAAQKSSLTCSRTQDGKCTWSYAECVYTVNNAAIDCAVGQWSAWKCSAPCGEYTKSYHNRTITRQPGTNGQACPVTFEYGNECQGTVATGCVNLPASISTNYIVLDANTGPVPAPVASGDNPVTSGTPGSLPAGGTSSASSSGASSGSSSASSSGASSGSTSSPSSSGSSSPSSSGSTSSPSSSGSTSSPSPSSGSTSSPSTSSPSPSSGASTSAGSTSASSTSSASSGSSSPTPTTSSPTPSSGSSSSTSASTSTSSSTSSTSASTSSPSPFTGESSAGSSAGSTAGSTTDSNGGSSSGTDSGQSGPTGGILGNGTGVYGGFDAVLFGIIIAVIIVIIIIIIIVVVVVKKKAGGEMA